MLKGTPRTPADRAAISRGLKRYHERLRQRWQILPGDRRELISSGTLRPEALFVLHEAEEEAREIAQVLGPDPSPQRQLLVADFARLGAVLRLELLRVMQTKEGDAVSRVSSLVGQRRATLQALGLERHAEEVPDLRSYLDAKARESEREAAQDAAGAANDSTSDQPGDQGGDGE